MCHWKWEKEEAGEGVSGVHPSGCCNLVRNYTFQLAMKSLLRFFNYDANSNDVVSLVMTRVPCLPVLKCLVIQVRT